MEKKINIGKWEAVTILINMINTKILLNFPRKMAEEAGNAGWLLAIYICILAFAGIYIVAKLYRNFEGKDLLDIGEHIGGSIGRIAVGSIFVTFL
ncbi:MAG: spore gernimation protein, partial [Ruminiclostridium sp.]|nr:spore gernimation protein [Ruminiclostridium sp.]